MENNIENNIGWYSANARERHNATGGVTWAEADRSWMKAKGRSIRTVLDSVDLMETRAKSRRRRKAGMALIVAGAGLGLAALLAFASGGGSSDGLALASDDNSTEQSQDAGGNITAGSGVGVAVATEASPAGSSAPSLAVSATGNAGPGGATVSGGGDVNNPANPFDTLPDPFNGGNSGGGGNGGGGTGGGGGDDGDDDDGDGGDDGGSASSSPVSASLSLGDPTSSNTLLSAGGAVEGLLDVSGEVSGGAIGDLGLDDALPETGILPEGDGGNLLDIDLSGDPENTDDPVDASADVNAGDTSTSANDDDLLDDALGGLLD